MRRLYRQHHIQLHFKYIQSIIARNSWNFRLNYSLSGKTRRSVEFSGLEKAHLIKLIIIPDIPLRVRLDLQLLLHSLYSALNLLDHVLVRRDAVLGEHENEHRLFAVRVPSTLVVEIIKARQRFYLREKGFENPMVKSVLDDILFD